MSSKTDYTVIERTYNVPIKNNVSQLVSYDLPIHWSVRLRHRDYVRVNMIGHDDSVDLAKCKARIRVAARNEEGKELAIVDQELDIKKTDENNWNFNHWHAVSYFVQIKIEIPIVHKKEMALDFNSDEVDHDRILILQERKFYVQSAYLSMWSKFFKTLFNGDFAEKDKKEITVKEVDPNEFEELLKVIYPSRKDIDASNVVYLWKLADRFDIQSVVHLCEQYMISPPGFFLFSLLDKFDLAIEIKSKKLEDKCRELMKKMSFET